MKNTHHTSRDSTVWTEAFERMEQFIRDTGLSRDIMMLFCWIGKNCDNHSKMFILKQQYKNT